MDRLTTYRETVLHLLKDRERLARQAARPGIETLLIVDDSGTQFMLMDLGWDGRTRVNSVYIQVRIKDGKIWIEQDWTEEGFANELVQAGVPKQDIVLAFQSPARRQHTDFAVA